MMIITRPIIINIIDMLFKPHLIVVYFDTYYRPNQCYAF